MPSKEVSPYLKKGKEGKGAPDAAMEMALRIKDPAIQATVARTLNKTRLGTTGSKDSDSTTKDEEEQRVSAREERARKKEELVNRKGSKGKGTKRADFQASGKESEKKIKRVRETDEGKERRIEEEHESARDLKMTAHATLDLPAEQHKRETERLKGEQEAGFKEQRTETEQLNKETEAERLKREQTDQEGRKMVQESVEKVLKGPASERAGRDNTLNIRRDKSPRKSRLHKSCCKDVRP
jgi:hypothetical protein